MARIRRTNLSHTFTGLPPNITVMLVDGLYKVETNDVWKALPRHVGQTSTEGVIRFDNLRDSIYSLLVVDFDYSDKSQYYIQIGDPDLFDTIIYHTIPTPVIITSVTTGVEGTVIYIDITWKLAPNGVDGFYHIYMQPQDGVWSERLVIDNPKTFSARISTSLKYYTQYTFKIRTLNEDGKPSAFSNLMSVITPELEHEDTTPPYNATFIQ